MIVQLSTITLCVIVWVWRRPEQLTRPYVWDEEADWLQLFVYHGWSGAFKAINGYFELPTNSLVVLSAQLSFVHVAGLMYLFATAVFLLSICLIVVPASYFGGVRTRCALASAAALVAVNPETFGVLLYSLWWFSLWPLILLGWKKPHYVARPLLLLAASLSSPAGGAMFLVYVAAYCRRRRRHDLLSALVLLAGFGTQVSMTVNSPRGAAVQKTASFLDIADQCLRTAGFYLMRWDMTPTTSYGFLTFAGLLLLCGLLYVACLLFRRGNEQVALLLLSGLVYIVLSALPAPLVTDPLQVGRYYFLPFIAISWCLVVTVVQVRSAHPAFRPDTGRDELSGPVQMAAYSLLLLAALSLPAAFDRSLATTTAKLSWSTELYRCANSSVPEVDLPVYLDGSKTAYWSVIMTPAQCHRLDR